MSYTKIPLLLFGISFATVCFGMEENKEPSKEATKNVALTQMWSYITTACILKDVVKTEDKIVDHLNEVTKILEKYKVGFFSSSEIYCKKEQINLIFNQLNLPIIAIRLSHLKLLTECSRHLPYLKTQNDPENIFLLKFCQSLMAKSNQNLLTVSNEKPNEIKAALDAHVKLTNNMTPIIDFLTGYNFD